MCMMMMMMASWRRWLTINTNAGIGPVRSSKLARPAAVVRSLSMGMGRHSTGKAKNTGTERELTVV
jgi:hypothetical protein